ncbi:unnamed protein product [Adineta ricciae]|uniref:DED domain-containing protein n=1 Tax=Adineta ricciae TaxID=249248 RepID=A0A815JA39_ADIRI|nr:unnamed protein product [Adineta ricciae]CAF1376683.1 unnamed protein product [Adineta ricciae]
MDYHHLCAILLNLQDRLANDDRKRLHFYLGNDIPRRFRDGPSLSGTLSLMDSLFDQDKINEDDLTHLINALEQIRRLDAYIFIEINDYGLNESVQSLSVIILPFTDQLLHDDKVEEDKEALKSDHERNKVRRWKLGEKGRRTLTAGGNGQGNQLNLLEKPTFIFVDTNQSI